MFKPNIAFGKDMPLYPDPHHRLIHRTLPSGSIPGYVVKQNQSSRETYKRNELTAILRIHLCGREYLPYLLDFEIRSVKNIGVRGPEFILVTHQGGIPHLEEVQRS